MPTSSLTSGGLQRYSRWLAIQKAKGRVPSSTEVSAFLQGEIEANISTDTEREKLSLSREQLDINRGQLDLGHEELGVTQDFYDRRLNLLEDAQDSNKRADKIRGISEIGKLGLAINEGTGGDLWKGVKAGAGAALDFGTNLFDTGSAAAAGASAGSEFAAFDFSDMIDDIFPDMASIWDF
jgi:hypothetical protein